MRPSRFTCFFYSAEANVTYNGLKHNRFLACSCPMRIKTHLVKEVSLPLSLYWCNRNLLRIQQTIGKSLFYSTCMYGEQEILVNSLIPSPLFTVFK